MRFTRKLQLVRGVLVSTLAAAALAIAPPVEAITIQFDQNLIPVSGTISFDGGGIGVGTVTGSNIMFDRVIGFDTPNNNGAGLICVACSLGFTTGTLTSVASGGGTTTYTFGSGGTLSMIGQIAPAPGVPPHPGNPAPVPIVSNGSFSFATLSVTGNSFTFSGRGIDEKDDLLVEYYFGLGSNVPPLEFSHSNTELGGTGQFGPGGAFMTSDLELADFRNEVPIPGTTTLFLLGLSGIVAHRRRKS